MCFHLILNLQISLIVSICEDGLKTTLVHELQWFNIFPSTSISYTVGEKKKFTAVYNSCVTFLFSALSVCGIVPLFLYISYFYAAFINE